MSRLYPRSLSRLLIGLVLLLTTVLPARAEDAGADQPGSWLPPTTPSSAPRVQRRIAPKDGRLHVSLGAEYLARGDFYVNPGTGLHLAYYLSEGFGLEVAATRFFPILREVAQEVRATSGYVPDSQPPGWLFRAGTRYSLGYGKLLASGRVVHFDPQLFTRVAGLTGETYPVALGLEGGITFLAHLGRRWHARLDLSLFPHLEHRSSWVPVMGVVTGLYVGYGFGAGGEQP